MATRGAGRATAAASAITRARRCWADSQATRRPNWMLQFPSIQRLVRYTDLSDARGVRSLGYE